MKKKTDANGNIVEYRALDTIFDALGVVRDCLNRFEVSTKLTTYIALPIIYKPMR